jgi:hypothetical protein
MRGCWAEVLLHSCRGLVPVGLVSVEVFNMAVRLKPDLQQMAFLPVGPTLVGLCRMAVRLKPDLQRTAFLFVGPTLVGLY